MKKETNAIRTQVKRSEHNEHSVPLYLTSSFVFDNAEHGRQLFSEEVSGNIYSRFSNPNTTEFIDKMTALENAEDGYAFASGMAAVFAGFAALLKSGDHILASRSLFGSSHQILTQILPKWGISFTYVDADKPKDWEKNINQNTKMIFIETPSNPGLEIIDLAWVGKLSKKHKLILNVDNCFATPIIQNPIEYGADLVTHSATKYIDGQGRVIGGVIVGRKELIKEIRFFARQTGPSLSPFNAWILSKSLETLSIRMEKHCSNAFQLANKLQNNSEIEFVKYPFLKTHPQYKLAKKQMNGYTGMLSFEINESLNVGDFLKALKMIKPSMSLAGVESTILSPAKTSHALLSPEERKRQNISDGLLRFSVGIEEVEDIIEDLEGAFQMVSKNAKSLK